MSSIFLQSIASDILNRIPEGLEKCTVIFPNKRPVSYFLNALNGCETYKGNPPSFLTFDDFILGLSRSRQGETLELLVILYKIYKKYYPDSEFDAFFAWGSLMLNDFDEIDRYMADPGRLFRNLAAAKDIETYFLNEFTLPDDFLKPLDDHDSYYLQQKFLDTWKVYEKCYFDLKNVLLSKGFSYTGMIYREVAENIQDGKIIPASDQYIFIGFNALSRSEENIIQFLVNAGKALIYWDIDTYFLDNPRENSGHFIRKHMQNLRGYNTQLTRNDLLTGNLNIHITGAPLLTGQVKALADSIGKSEIKRSAVIVLPDENLLVPLLPAISQFRETINITPGYPLIFSSLYGLFQSLISLRENYKPESDSFYHKDVMAILSHPFIQKSGVEELKAFSQIIKKNQLIYIQSALAEKTLNAAHKIFFKNIRGPENSSATNNEIISQWFIDITGRLGQIPVHDPEEVIALKSFADIFANLHQLIQSSEIDISIKTFRRLLKEKISQVKLRFSEDNPDAFQVMGMLETRCLDFEDVFILSANEGTLPGSSKNQSYIPFDLRKSYGLPTAEEQEHLYAYNFFRLFPGAKNVYLFYNSETGSSGEEKSRYLRQVEYFMPKANPGISIIKTEYTIPLISEAGDDIIIQKDSAFREAIAAKCESGISPSYLSSYFICPLQFYFNHIARIPQAEEITEDLEARHFGTLFHELMDQVYHDLAGKTASAEIIKEKKSMLRIFMDRALDKIHKTQKDNILERNNLLVETVLVLAEKTLDADIDYTPFMVMALEKEIITEMTFSDYGIGRVKLKGTIDRIDEKNGVLRIVDYKTGAVKKFDFYFRENEETLTKENKEAFQAIFYGMIYDKTHPGTALRPVIMPLKEVVKGYMNINETDANFASGDFEVFAVKLKSIIKSILDPATPIIQTSELNICANCSYKNICMR